jgi:PAT family beta-lactamase induction signal transducer AmpG
MPVNIVTELGLFTLIILLHNAFGATQDVAIDALAVNVLPEEERGLANGFMFAGASIGQTIGGSGVLFLTSVVPFKRHVTKLRQKRGSPPYAVRTSII